MTSEPPCEAFAERVYDLVSREAPELALRWLEAVQESRGEDASRVFPTKSLLNHIPLLLRRMIHGALFDEEAIERDFVRQELTDLAILRRGQGYGPAEIAEEFDLLADSVLEFVEERAGLALTEASPNEVMYVVSRLRRALDRMSSITQEVYRAQTSSEHAQRQDLLQEFGRAVTHELRNRLNTVLLTLEAYRQTRGTPKGDELLANLEAAVRRSEGVVSDVFSVVIARGERDPVNTPRASLAQVMTGIVEDMRFLADEHDVALSCEMRAPDVRVDPVRVQLVLSNLISNAIKYHDPTKNDRFVAVSVHQEEAAKWRIDVEDNGVGVEVHEQDSIFDREVRGEGTGAQPGQGLGLHIASKAAQNLGGELWLESSSPQGSHFCFTLVGPAEALLDSEN